jgi:asparagine synthase (glutamine-hydrolysing)
VLHPLFSQPVVEACLAIPSWEWRAGGIDRAVARQAFAADLPEEILRRRTKGGPDGFCAEIIRHHHARIRARLLDGALARQGILDRVAVEKALGADRPLSGCGI